MSKPWKLHNNADRLRRPPMTWVIDSVLPPTGVGQIYGTTGSGKSFVAIDLALRICNGLDAWYGNPIRVKGPVVYVFMEGVHDQQARIDAWLIAHPGTSADNLYTLDEEPLDLADPASVTKLVTAIAEEHIEPKLVIIDTQALSMAGVEENDNGEMGRVLAFLKRWSKAAGYPILTVHHAGKDLSKGARGASAWHAGLDLQIHVASQQLKVTKVKGAPSSDYMGFRLALSAHSVWAKPSVGSDGLQEVGISQNILDYIEANPAQKTMKQVVEHFAKSGKATIAFNELLKNEEILPVEIERAEGARKAVKRTVWVVSEETFLDMSEAGTQAEWEALSDEERSKLVSGDH